jgi:hypothetical protein
VTTSCDHLWTQTSDSDFNTGTNYTTLVSDGSVSFDTCGGYGVGDKCWYKASAYGLTCNEVCASHGGCRGWYNDPSCTICKRFYPISGCFNGGTAPGRPAYLASASTPGCRYSDGGSQSRSANPGITYHPYMICVCNE